MVRISHQERPIVEGRAKPSSLTKGISRGALDCAKRRRLHVYPSSSPDATRGFDAKHGLVALRYARARISPWGTMKNASGCFDHARNAAAIASSSSRVDSP